METQGSTTENLLHLLLGEDLNNYQKALAMGEYEYLKSMEPKIIMKKPLLSDYIIDDPNYTPLLSDYIKDDPSLTPNYDYKNYSLALNRYINYLNR